MTKFSSAARRRVMTAAVALMATTLAVSWAQAATYTWNVASGAWTSASSWTPARTTPAATDELVFDGGTIPVAAATGVPTETIARLSVVNGAQATLSAGAAVTLTIAGGAGTDLDVPLGSLLALSGLQAITLTLSAGATGLVGGSMTSGGGGHRVNPVDAGSLVYKAGSTFRTIAGHSGSVFGTSGASGAVVFQSGATYRHGAGANPFGTGPPASRVTLQSGSIFRQEINSGMSLASRTYGNLEIDMGATGLNFTGAASNGPTIENNLTVISGTLGIITTSGNFPMIVRGNLTVQPGATLSFNSTSPGTTTLMFSGGGAQSISAAGTLTLNALNTLQVVNAGGVSLMTDVTSSGTVTLVSGNLHTGPNLLRLTAGAAIADGANWVNGGLARDYSTGPTVDRVFPVGDATVKSPVSVRLTTVSATGTLVARSIGGDHPALAGSGLRAARSVNRWWSVSPGAFTNPTFASAVATLNYPSSALDPGVVPANLAVGKRDGSTWTLPAHTTGTSTSIQATGLTSFSEFAVAELVPNDAISPQAPAGCISTSNPCVAVPVRWDRDDTTPARSYSVTIELSPNLSLCGVQFASAGYLAPGSNGTPFFGVIPLGGNQWTVDEATLGLPCGATGDGTLFTVFVTSGDPGGTGSVGVVSTLARDCANAPIPANPGDPVTIPIDNAVPAAVTLAATQRKTGNAQPPFGTTDVLLSWTGQEVGTTMQVYRKGFGGYPQYDEVPGTGVPTAPPTPAAAVLAGWTPTGVTVSGGADRTAARDFQYYVAFATDGCGNVSPVSNRTNGTLNYHLGDTHDGVANCSGNDLVNTSDISFLGANYGVNVPINGAVECLDVGPSTDTSVDGRPTTDNRIQFEDLILFAINHGNVSGPQARAVPAPAAIDALTLGAQDRAPVGGTLTVPLLFEGTGAIQGLSAQIGYDGEVAEFLGVEAGPLLAAQARPGVALSSGPGDVDVAVLGPGEGLLGRGELARARFRVVAAGDPRIRLTSAIARDRENRGISLGGGAPAPVATIVPDRTVLEAARPSPFQVRTTLECALARAGSMKLAIYGIDGRRFRTLADGPRAAGVHRFVWDGRDDSGREVAAGVYFARLISDSGDRTRTVIKLR